MNQECLGVKRVCQWANTGKLSTLSLKPAKRYHYAQCAERLQHFQWLHCLQFSSAFIHFHYRPQTGHCHGVSPKYGLVSTCLPVSCRCSRR